MDRAQDVAAIPVDYDVALEVASHEAIIRQAYKDSVGVLTWSVGLTNATGHNVERYVRNPSSLQHALNIYVWALDRYAQGVRDAFKGHKLTKAQFAAALSFHWNTGGIKRAAWVRHWKAGRIAQARTAFMAWAKPKEIIPRRRKERDLFFDGKWSNQGVMTEYTRVTSRLTPVWSSAIRIDVRDELQAAFKSTGAPVLDHKPKPNNKPAAPTLSPELPEPMPKPPQRDPAPKPPQQPAKPEPAPTGFWALIFNLLRRK